MQMNKKWRGMVLTFNMAVASKKMFVEVTTEARHGLHFV